MEMYILKSTACLGTLLLFYKLLLEKENMHVFKRFYLIFALFASILIPFVTFTTYVEVPLENVPVLVESSATTIAKYPVERIDYLSYFLWGFYAMGVLFFSIKFINNLWKLIIKIKRNPKIKNAHTIKVLLNEEIPPHTFFRFIFLNRQKYNDKAICSEVLAHEVAHAKQKHSIDVVLSELFQIVMWFNPLVYFLKHFIKLNHEFLADRAVLKKGADTSTYQQTILAYSSQDFTGNLVNPINYSSIKKRFRVMKTKTSKTAIWVRSIFLLPLLTILIYGFSTKKTVEKESIEFQVNPVTEKPTKTQTNNKMPFTIEISSNIDIHIYSNGELLVNGKKTSLDMLQPRLKEINSLLSLETKKLITVANISTEENISSKIITNVKRSLIKYGVSKSNIFLKKERQKSQEKATPEMIAEYNKLANYYNSQPKNYTVVNLEDFSRMKYIYDLMTAEQKKNAEKFPDILLPPPPPAPLTPETNGEGNIVAPPPPPPVPEAPEAVNTPEIPPAPPAPLEHMKQLAEEGAEFYYEGKEITSEKAIKLAENNKNLRIQVTDTGSGRELVQIFDKEK